MGPPSELTTLEHFHSFCHLSQGAPLIWLGTAVVQVLSSRPLVHSWTVPLQHPPVHFLERQDPEGKAWGALPTHVEVFFTIT